MALARFRFYEELNEFLPPERRKCEFDARFARAATVKNAIEALGVPHTEVELVLVNGESVDFGYRMREGDRVSVYPVFEALDVRPLVRVRPEPLRVTRFIADAHLGGLARFLRMAGFDTRYDNAYSDDEIRRLASEEHRIVLTRDRALLLCKTITHGCYVHARRSQDQFREIVQRLQLRGSMRPFARCLHCNVLLIPVEKNTVVDVLPPMVRERYDRFTQCPACRGVFWQGSHWERMRAILSASVPEGLHEG